MSFKSLQAIMKIFAISMSVAFDCDKGMEMDQHKLCQ